MAALFAVDANVMTNQRDCTQSLDALLRQLKDTLDQQTNRSEFPTDSGMNLLKQQNQAMFGYAETHTVYLGEYRVA